jgi:alkyldihydroxyacetonephosphate synthase
MTPFAQALAQVLPLDRVSARPEDRAVYARDMWPRSLLAVAAGVPPEHPPDLIVWPAAAAEVQAVVRLCRQHGVPLYPFGAGSGVCGGAAPHGGVVLDLKRMRDVHIDREAMTVTFQPGILGAHLERALLREGLTLGHFPSSIMCSTGGGWLATRGAGQCSTRYGKIEDMVRAGEVVLGTGEVVTLSTDTPDLLQLIVGSEGTLGIIVSATCVVRPAPAVRRMRGFSFPWVASACQGIRRLLQSGLRPAVVRLYDELDTLISGQRGHAGGPLPERALVSAQRPPRHAPEELGPDEGGGQELTLDEVLDMVRPDVRRAGKGLERWLVSRALGRPGLINRLAERVVPRLSPGCRLILGFEGEEALTAAEERAALAELQQAGGRDLGPGPGEHWLRHRYDIHAYPDGCSIYFTFAGRRTGGDLAADQARYDALWQAALSAVVRAGGTISHHHGIGRLKARFMEDEHGPGMGLLLALKRALDPDNILNPGKLGLPEHRS